MEEVTEIRLDDDCGPIFQMIGGLQSEDSKTPIMQLVSSEQWRELVKGISATVQGVADRAYRLGIERGKREAAYERD